MMNRRLFALLFLAGMLVLSACETGNTNATAIPMFPTRISGTPLPTFDSGAARTPFVTPFVTQPPFITASPTPNSAGWNGIVASRTGGFWRTFAYRNSQGAVVNVLAARFDPSAFNFRVHYLPGQVLNIAQWKQLLPNAVAIVNTVFFTPQNLSLGLVVADGNTLAGYLNRNDSGIFQVKNGAPKVRSLWLEPLVGGEAITQAVQTYPILVAMGQVAPINPDVAGVIAARTVVAQDRSGNVIFLVTGGAGTNLADLGNWLGLSSGMDILYALNMDGGNSTNLYLSTGGTIDYIPGLRGIPAVLAVYPK